MLTLHLCTYHLDALLLTLLATATELTHVCKTFAP